MGVGNTLRGDDGLGSLLARRLAERLEEGCADTFVIDAGSAPENHLGVVLRENPDILLIVDAMDMGLAPGEFELVEADEAFNRGLSTHDISLRMLADFLKAQIDLRIFILGIQPQSIDFGESVCPTVADTLDRLEEMIIRLS
jgi:hydrogenase 3 maturation protease